MEKKDVTVPGHWYCACWCTGISYQDSWTNESINNVINYICAFPVMNSRNIWKRSVAVWLHSCRVRLSNKRALLVTYAPVTLAKKPNVTVYYWDFLPGQLTLQSSGVFVTSGAARLWCEHNTWMNTPTFFWFFRRDDVTQVKATGLLRLFHPFLLSSTRISFNQSWICRETQDKDLKKSNLFLAFCVAWALSADLMSAPRIRKKQGVSLCGNFCYQLQKNKCLIQVIIS